MINTHLLELPLSRTYFSGSKGVRAIEVLLYKHLLGTLEEIEHRLKCQYLRYPADADL